MKKQGDDQAARERLRVKRETLRGLGFDELAAVQGGHLRHGRPSRTRNCLEPD